MWPRAVEIGLGVWLGMSPFIFRYTDDMQAWRTLDLAAAALIIGFGLLSFWRPSHRAHVVTLFVAGLLAGYSYFVIGQPAPAHAQNHLIVGILLAMLALIPSQYDKPRVKWERYYSRVETR
jgi:CHASE2 domain-containing sensor protein